MQRREFADDQVLISTLLIYDCFSSMSINIRTD